MFSPDLNRTFPDNRTPSSLAGLGMRSTDREPDQKLARVNSICLLFLLIGVVGSKPGAIAFPPLALMPEVSAVMIEPAPPPPETSPDQTKPDLNQQEKTDTPQIVVVTPDAPAINFAVPTMGNLVVPSAVAKAPPLNPLQPPVPLKSQPAALASTGTGGERPQPPYPRIALDQHEQGAVRLLLSADDAGTITTIEIQESSGFPILDRSAVDYITRHWTVPPGSGARRFESTIRYRIQAN